MCIKGPHRLRCGGELSEFDLTYPLLEEREMEKILAKIEKKIVL